MRVIIADDSQWLRSDYRRALIASNVDVVAEAGSAEELINQVRDLKPDAVMLDICLNGIGGNGHDEDGLHAAITLRHEYPDLGLLIFSVFMTPSYLMQILDISERHIGYLGKDRITDFSIVVDALHIVANGGTAIDEHLMIELLRHRPTKDMLDGLSARKRQALELLSTGLSNKAIAARMDLAEQTVEKYMNEIFSVLQIPQTPDVNKRVLAVLTLLRETGALPEY